MGVRTISKLIIVVFEGMSYQLLNEWSNLNKLPNFKRLNNENGIRQIACSRIPYEASGLTSAFSGISDSEHGIMSYWQIHNKDYTPSLWDSTHLKDKMVWNQDNLKQYKFGVVNVFGTHPVYEMNGFMISYAMKQHSLRYSYPNSILHDLSKKGVNYIQDLTVFFSNQEKKDFCKGVERVDTIRHNAFRELLKEDADVLIINYTSIDRVCHFYMNELLKDDLDIEDKAVFQAYAQCDKILGELLDEIEKTNADLMFFSEIGFGQLKAFVQINDYLLKEGFLKWNHSTNRPEWGKTLAFESVQGSHGININRKSMYKDGIVSEEEYDDVLESVVKSLKNMENPHTGNPMFSKVFNAKSYYANSTIVPDILLEPYDWQYLPYGDNYWADIVSRHSQTGWHRNMSVWGGSGPNITNKIKEQKSYLIDIVPTMYHILGEKIPQHLKGSSLVK